MTRRRSPQTGRETIPLATRPRAVTRARDPQAGVSLVEVMVVLVIVGIMSGVALLGFGGGPGAEAEARRLADRMQFAADEALVTGAPRALVWDPAGYRFVVWDAADKEWRAEPRPLLSGHTLPRMLALRGPGDAAPVLFAPDRAAAPVHFRIGGPAEFWTVAFDGLTARAAPATP